VELGVVVLAGAEAPVVGRGVLDVVWANPATQKGPASEKPRADKPRKIDARLRFSTILPTLPRNSNPLTHGFGSNLANLPRCCDWVGRVKDRSPCDECVGARLRQLGDILQIDAPIDLDSEASIIA